MRLADLAEKINTVKAKIWYSRDLPKDVFVFLLICLVGVGAFLLGRMGSMEASRKAELRILQTDASGGGESVFTPVGNATSSTGGKVLSEDAQAVANIQGMYVGSRNGTTYYLPWCGGVKLIHEENKIWFASKEDAQSKGYRPAGNCKGI